MADLNCWLVVANVNGSLWQSSMHCRLQQPLVSTVGINIGVGEMRELKEVVDVVLERRVTTY